MGNKRKTGEEREKQQEWERVRKEEKEEERCERWRQRSSLTKLHTYEDD